MGIYRFKCIVIFLKCVVEAVHQWKHAVQRTDLKLQIMIYIFCMFYVSSWPCNKYDTIYIQVHSLYIHFETLIRNGWQLPCQPYDLKGKQPILFQCTSVLLVHFKNVLWFSSFCILWCLQNAHLHLLLLVGKRRGRQLLWDKTQDNCPAQRQQASQ